MIQRILNLIIIFSLVLLTSCGYTVDKSINNFYISSVDINTRNRDILNLKKYLLDNQNLEAKVIVTVNLQLESEQNIKEKAKTGKILSYNLIFNSLIKTNINNITVTKEFSVSDSYDVGSNHSTTIYNEKKLKEILLNKLAEDIKIFLKSKITT